MKFDILYHYLQNKKLCEKLLDDFQRFFNSKSQPFQVLTYFIINKTGTAEYIEDRKELKNYQISTLLKRLNDNEKIESIDKEGKYKVYQITNKGKVDVDRTINHFLQKNFIYNEYIKHERKEKVNSKDINNQIKTVLSGLVEANIKPDIYENIVIDMKSLANWDYEAVDYIYANFRETIQFIIEYFKDDIEDISEDNIYFTNIHESEFNTINYFDREEKGIIYTKGLVTSKKESIISKTKNIYYLCSNPNCKFSEDKIITFRKIKTCPRCKSKVEIINETRINQLESKITDIETGISFPIHIYGSKSREFSNIGLGDEIEVIGYLEDKITEEKNGVIETTKVLIVNNWNKTDYVKPLTKEEQDLVEKILIKYDNPLNYLKKPFRNYIEADWVKELIIIQQLTRLNKETKEVPLNIAIMGEPGVGKNELIKMSEEYFPNCDSISGADITDAGFKGTVNRDTGIKEIGLAKKCQGGSIFFNEFDKFVKSNPNGKKGASQLLNGSITEQEIRLNKAGIRIRMQNLDLRHNVIFNPLDEKIINKEETTPYDLMGQILDKSLLSRMLPIYIDRDDERTKKVFDIFLENNHKSPLPDKEKYKLVIRYLRAKDIEFTPKAKEILKQIFENILKNDEYKAISVERISQMIIQLCRGVTKAQNKSKCDKEIVEYVKELYWKCLASVGINLQNLDQLFLDKKPEEITEKYEIKQLILKDITTQGKFYLSVLKEHPKQDLIKLAVEEIKREEDIYEPRKGELRRIE